MLGCIPIALLWANVHGSFPVALILGAAFAVGAFLEPLLVQSQTPHRVRMSAAVAAARPYAVTCIVMAIAMLINPYGPELFRVSWDLQNSAFVRSHIYEWMPTFFGPFVGSRGFWAFLIYLMLVAVIVFYGCKSISPSGWLLLLVFVWLALRTQRHIALLAFVSVYPLSTALGPIASRVPRISFALGGLLVLLIGCTGLLLRYGNMYGGFPYFVESRNFSPLFIDYVQNNHLRGNVLNSYALGAELVYRFYPRLRPAIDSRIDVYGERYFLYLLGLNSDERSLRQFIARYRVRYILLLRPEFDEGIRRMPHMREDGWRIAFADHKLVLLDRPAQLQGSEVNYRK